jgi:hypothetical protein
VKKFGFDIDVGAVKAVITAIPTLKNTIRIAKIIIIFQFCLNKNLKNTGLKNPAFLIFKFDSFSLSIFSFQ